MEQARAARIAIGLVVLGGCLAGPSDPAPAVGTLAAASTSAAVTPPRAGATQVDVSASTLFDLQSELAQWEKKDAHGPLARTRAREKTRDSPKGILHLPWPL